MQDCAYAHCHKVPYLLYTPWPDEAIIIGDFLKHSIFFHFITVFPIKVNAREPRLIKSYYLSFYKKNLSPILK